MPTGAVSVSIIWLRWWWAAVTNLTEARSSVSKNNSNSYQNRVRIIGGEYRRRVLEFPDQPGLRPTPDRVRETVFN